MAMVKAVFVAVAAVAALAQLATAVDYTVGGNGAKWDASGTNYDAWSATQKFTTKDSLVFNYVASHNVMEVSKADYDACSPSTSKTLARDSAGKTTIKLTTAGKHYFICGVPGHCDAGMKLVVNVVAASTATPAKPRGQRSVAPVAAPAPAPEGPSTDEQLPNVSSPTGAPGTPSGAASIGAKAAVALAMGMAVALAL
ncbi:unnamed protein product [Alopecurus aequalis]